jgi:hypothetical protein
MELVIILAVVAFGVWYFFLRDKELIKEATSEAPYKVDVPPVVEPAKVEPVVEAPAEVGKSADDRVEATAPVAEPVKAERQVKPRAKKGPTAPAKATAKAPAKATAKAPAKPRAKKAPTMTVAK